MFHFPVGPDTPIMAMNYPLEYTEPLSLKLLYPAMVENYTLPGK